MRKRILLADDDSSVRELLTYTLGKEDFLILHARDGHEAIDLARAQQPDLLLLDLLMPEMDGLDVCRILKADPSTAHIKIIILTAMTDLRERLHAMAAGADGFFSKPFSPVSLLNKVYETLQ